MAQTTIAIGPELRKAMIDARDALGMTQDELGEADQWGDSISTETISKIETGRGAAATLRKLTILLLRLGIPAEDVRDNLDDGYPQAAARMSRIAARDASRGASVPGYRSGNGRGSAQ